MAPFRPCSIVGLSRHVQKPRWLPSRAFGLLLLGGVTLCGAVLGVSPVQGMAPSGWHPDGREVDLDTWADANDIEMVVTNVGSIACDMTSSSAGLIYPSGTTKTAVFAAGLWLGAYSNGELRVTVAEYSDMYSPGPILSPTSWGDAGSPYYRVYKINAGDMPSSNPDYDLWLHWPPLVPGGPPLDHGMPRLLGDQTLWSVYNDLNPNQDGNDGGTTAPLGVQVRQSIFSFQDPPNNRIVFLEYEIINGGAGPLNDVFVSLWADPDLGGSTDDLVGCDTLRQVGFCYNATNADNIYGAEPPAVGIVLLQGPIVPAPGQTAWVNGQPVPGYRNLPMTSFQKYINGTDPRVASTTYNYMRGLLADGAEMVDPTTGGTTRFAVPGDPVEGTGWLDADPADRRMMVSCGPFNMAPGEMQVVTAALLIGQGSDRLASISDLRSVSDRARTTFSEMFPAQPTPVQLASFEARPGPGGVRVSWRLGEIGENTNLLLDRDCGGGWTAVREEPFRGLMMEFLDTVAEPGSICRYRLSAIDASGERVFLGETQAEVPTLSGLALHVQRNPSRGPVMVTWNLPTAGEARLEAFAPSGRRLCALMAESAPAGPGQMEWDGSDAAGRPVSGVVWLRLTAATGTAKERIVLVR
jgi:hypothetical protein